MIEQDEIALAENGSAVAPASGPVRRARLKRPGPAVLSTSARDLAYVFFRWKWDILLIVLLALIGSAVYLWVFRGVLYESSAKLLVKLGQEQAPPTTMLGDRTLLISQRPQDVNSEIDILKSTDLLERVVEKLGLDKPAAPDPVPSSWMAYASYEARKFKTLVKDEYKEILIRAGLKKRLTPREEAVEVLQHALVVKAYPESNVFVATLRTPTPQGAGAILNGIIDEYIEFRRTMFSDDQSVDYFREEAETSSAQVQAVEREIAKFETDNDFQNAAKQQELLLSTREETRKSMNNAEVAYQIASMKLQRFEEINKDSTADFSSLGEFEENSYPAALMLEMMELTNQREALREGTGAPPQQLAKVERQRAGVLLMLGKYLRALEAERKQEYENLKAQFAETTGKLDQIRAAQTTHAESQRKLKVAQDNYYFYQKRYEESAAVAAMQEKRIGNVSVIQHATDPLEPAGVSKVKLFLFGIVFSMFAAFGWAAVREYFDHTINTVDQLRRRIDAPVFATVPVIRSRG